MRIFYRMRFAVLCAPLLGATVLNAQPADTTKLSADPLFTRTDAYIAGMFTLGLLAAWPLDKSAANRLQDSSVQEISFAKRSAKFFHWMGTPGSLYIGTSMYAAGRLAGRSRNARRVADLGLHGTEAVLLASNIVGVFKGIAGRARPYVNVDDPHNFGFGRGFKQSQYRSFPSGHSVMGFAAASAVTAEVHKWEPKATPYVAPVMYGGATLIALSRMYDNFHWASDVTVGAAIGTFTGLKVVKYHHSHPNNRIDRWLLAKDPQATTTSRSSRLRDQWTIGASLLPEPRGGVSIVWSISPSGR